MAMFEKEMAVADTMQILVRYVKDLKSWLSIRLVTHKYLLLV